jgi:hypothetical protein
MSEALDRIRAFVDYVASLTGDEKGEAQVFCDRLFQAFGHDGYKEAGATLEYRVKQGVSGQLKAASGGEFKSSHFTGSAVRGWFSSTHLMLMEIAHGECSGNGDCSSNSKLICRKMVPAPDRA